MLFDALVVSENADQPASTMVQYLVPSAAVADATPIWVKAGLRMLARWPLLPIQPATTDEALVYPAATFSPQVLGW